jgi:hypothetical protein
MFMLSCFSRIPLDSRQPLMVYFRIMQFVVGLGDKVSPTDIEEGMRVG